MTKSEAYRRVAEIKHSSPAYFCPLIRTTCNPSCVCSSDAAVTQTSEFDFQIEPRGCANRMFWR